jgi:pimeloyl-ACP methyl ester carboxylesterase
MMKKLAHLALKLLPENMGFALMRSLASKVARLPAKDNEATALKLAQMRMIGSKTQIKLWTWGQGPVVLLVHGWGGSAAQMAPLAAEVALAGFQAVTFDLSGHGQSLESVASWENFFRDLDEVNDALGPLFAFIGHSAGGLALMASRQIKSVNAQRHICICAPSYPHPPVQAIQARLDPGNKLLDRYREFLAEQFRSSWSALENGQAFVGAAQQTLLIYDSSDRYISHTEGDRIQAWCPEVSLVKTDGLGHVRILSSEQLRQLVTDFLQKAN